MLCFRSKLFIIIIIIIFNFYIALNTNVSKSPKIYIRCMSRKSKYFLHTSANTFLAVFFLVFGFLTFIWCMQFYRGKCATKKPYIGNTFIGSRSLFPIEMCYYIKFLTTFPRIYIAFRVITSYQTNVAIYEKCCCCKFEENVINSALKIHPVLKLLKKVRDGDCVQ